MKVAIYCRVSTADQNAQMQLDELKLYCERRGWSDVQTFIDEGISGSKASRPALDQLMKRARRKAFDVVLVYKFDRFARSMKQLINTLAEFDSLGVQFISLHEQIDTTSPNGRLMFGIFSAFAEFERSLIIARTKSGMQAAKARGKQIGRPALNVDCAKVANLRAQGHSNRAIARMLNVSEGTVRGCVKRLSETSVVSRVVPQPDGAVAVA